MRVGIAGKRGAAFVAGLRSVAGVEVAALCEADPAALAAVGDRHAIAARFPSYEEMLASRLDAVVVATPMQLHVPHALAALAAGRHVLSEVTAGVTLELCGVHSLSFAVGAYLPIATTAPIFIGGLVRWWVERKTGETEESDLSAGTLFSSGLIAGGSLAGILFAVLVGLEQRGIGILPAAQSIGNAMPFLREGNVGQIAGAAMFFVLAVILTRFAQRKV